MSKKESGSLDHLFKCDAVVYQTVYIIPLAGYLFPHKLTLTRVQLPNVIFNVMLKSQDISLLSLVDNLWGLQTLWSVYSGENAFQLSSSPGIKWQWTVDFHCFAIYLPFIGTISLFVIWYTKLCHCLASSYASPQNCNFK